jgi:sugar porter (SP) family MFS transporter
MNKVLSKATSASSSELLELNVLGLTLVFMTPMLGGFMYGFDIGATSFVLSMLLQDQQNHHHHSHDDNDTNTIWWTDFGSVQQGLFVSALSLGALLGSHLVLMYFSHTMGRRTELRVCAVLYIVGTVLNVASGTVLKHASIGFTVLFLGRLTFGMGVGFIMHGAPAYMAEMCPPQIRGAVVSAKETVIVGGIVLGYATGNWMSTSSSDDPQAQQQQQQQPNWTDLYAVCGVIAVPMLVLTYYIPRSKRWLLMKGYRQEAYESMQFVYKGDIDNNFHLLVESTRMESNPQYNSFCESSNDDNKNHQTTPSLWSRQYRSAMMASMGLIVFQQFSGQPSVLSYATVLFQAAGWSGNASVATSVLMMLTSMTTVALVDRVGRKRLLSACCIVMMTALSALSLSFWGWDDQVTIEFGQGQKLVILVAMCVYIGGYQVGFGPITWCVVSEIFPLEIRGKAIALGVELNYLLNFLVQFTFPIIQDTLGWGPSFCLFGVILAFAFFFVQVFVPETTGLTLEEIQWKLSQRDQQGGSDYFPTDRSPLIPEQAPLLVVVGAGANLEEMENQKRIRTHSDTALAQKDDKL